MRSLRPLRSSPRRLVALAALGVLSISALGAAAACGGSSGSSSSSSSKVTLRLGFFPNLTHASALVGIDKGVFAQKLGSNVDLKTSSFNAGPAATEALFSGAIDATYIGPNPTVNGFVKSKGQALRVISGSASGGVAFVVKPSITKPADLKGKKIATPQLGNTQDVALRYWLKQNNLTSTKEGGGDVSVKPQDNAVTLQSFASGTIDGAWVPEPWVSQLVAKGGHILVDERTLWPDGKFVITNLIVRTDFLKAHPDVVKKLLEGQVAANDYIHSNPTESQQAVSDEIGKITGKPLDVKLITAAWPTLEFLNDPIASSLTTGAQHAEDVGLLDKVDLKGLYDLGPLNDVLKTQGKTEVPLP